MVTSIDAKKVALQFVKACLNNGIPIKKAILFGSFAKGKADENSDIDLAIIADSFGNNIIQNTKQTALLNWEYSDIEVHHFNTEVFESGSRFIDEINLEMKMPRSTLYFLSIFLSI